MASAAAKVFIVPELLETVLLNLPRIKLSEVCRINKAWRDTINTSPKLRQRLYLDFEQASSETRSGTNEQNSKNKINPIFLYLINNGLIYKPTSSGKNAHSCVAPWRTSPHEPLRHSVLFFMPQGYNTETFAKHLGIRGDGQQASWRAMKLTRLPVAIRVEITIYWQHCEGTHYHVIDFAAGEGSLGEVVDAMDRVRRDAAGEASGEL